MHLHLKIKANSRVDQLAYDETGRLTVKIKAPAQDGKANEYLINYLANCLDLPKSAIRIASGLSNPYKKLEIEGEESEVNQKLARLIK